ERSIYYHSLFPYTPLFRSPDARINDRFGRFEFYAYRNGNTYSLRSPILAHGTIGIELLAKDKFRSRDPFYGCVNFIDVQVNDRRSEEHTSELQSRENLVCR